MLTSESSLEQVEDQVLTPSKLVNRKLWAKITMDELEKLDEFEQLENMVASEDNQPITMQDLMEDSVMSLSDHEPVQSKILNKYFPSQIKRLQELNDRQEDDSHQEIQKLEQEISRLKISNQKLKKENEDKDRQHKRLKKEQEEFESYKKAEMDRIQQLHLENVKSLKRERQLWEKQRKAQDIIPSKRERQEMELLRAQLREQAEGFKSKETRMQSTQERLRKKIQDLETKNRELQDEIKTLEKERARFVERHAAEKPILKKPPLREVRESTMLKTQEVTLPNPNTSMESYKSGYQDHAKNDLDKIQQQLDLQPYLDELKHADGKRERIYPDGTKLVRLVNGTTKCVHASSLEVYFFTNGDSKTVSTDGTVEYWYSEPKIRHLTYPNGEQLLEFSNGQVERRYQDGTQEILFVDKTVKIIFPDQSEQITFPDGMVKRVQQGKRTITYPDGTVEVHDHGIRTKTYPDGLLKRVFEDGSQEVIWPDGRVRRKNANGVPVS